MFRDTPEKLEICARHNFYFHMHTIQPSKRPVMIMGQADTYYEQIHQQLGWQRQVI